MNDTGITIITYPLFEASRYTKDEIWEAIEYGIRSPRMANVILEMVLKSDWTFNPQDRPSAIAALYHFNRSLPQRRV
jgi:hypothetical protein